MKIMIDSEYLDRLQKSLGADAEGNAVVGKNLEVDGTTKLNGGFEPIHTYKFTDEEGLEYRVSVFYETYNESENVHYFSGKLYDIENESTLWGFGHYLVENGKIIELIVFSDQASDNLYFDAFVNNSSTGQLTHKYSSFITIHNTKTLFGNQSIVGDGNIDLYRHRITVSNPEVLTTTPISSLTFEYISSNPLICDSLQDLRELMHATTSKVVCANGWFTNPPYTPGLLNISATDANIVFNSSPVLVTKVEDTVTTI